MPVTTRAKKATAAPTDKGDDRRKRILDAARRRFAASGFESTTVRQIADDVGLLAGSLYYHFANKEQLLHETLRDVVHRLRDGAQAIHGRKGDAESKLVALIFFDVAERTLNQEAHAILHQERALFRQNPDLDYIRTARRAHYLVWRALIEQGIAQGAFSADINIFLTLTTVIRMLNTGAEWFLHDDPSVIDAAGIISRDELSAFYARLVLRTIRTPARITAPIPWPQGYVDVPQG